MKVSFIFAIYILILDQTFYKIFHKIYKDHLGQYNFFIFLAYNFNFHFVNTYFLNSCLLHCVSIQSICQFAKCNVGQYLFFVDLAYNLKVTFVCVILYRLPFCDNIFFSVKFVALSFNTTNETPYDTCFSAFK